MTSLWDLLQRSDQAFQDSLHGVPEDQELEELTAEKIDKMRDVFTNLEVQAQQSKMNADSQKQAFTTLRNRRIGLRTYIIQCMQAFGKKRISGAQWQARYWKTRKFVLKDPKPPRAVAGIPEYRRFINEDWHWDKDPDINDSWVFYELKEQGYLRQDFTWNEKEIKNALENGDPMAQTIAQYEYTDNFKFQPNKGEPDE